MMTPSPRKTPLWVAPLGVILAIAAIWFGPRPDWVDSFATLAYDVWEGVVEYLQYAVGAFVLAWIVLHPVLKRRMLARRRWPRLPQVAREILFSVATQVVFLATAIWLFWTDSMGAANMYTVVADYGVLYFGLTVFMVLVLHDTAFYWTHRMMHHPVLFERVHRVHHESVDPTPFTAYSFHPLEAIVEQVSFVWAVTVVALIMPWHPAAIAVGSTLQLIFNVIAHLGYEIYPRGWHRLPVLRWKTPATHHYMHHQRVGGNYGLYFRWWDRICGTEFRDYEARYDQQFATTDRSPRLDEQAQLRQSVRVGKRVDNG